MDLQATMMNNTGGAFQAAGNLPFNIAEIWPFPINAGAANLNRDHLIPLNDPMVVDQRTNHGGRLAKKQREDDELAQGVSTSGNGLSESDSKRLKATGSNENEESRGDGEGNSIEQSAKLAEAHKDYIHVRARRGQATDSHSLAERARREKIGEKMKTLQDLVPGCSKVIGKALVLDEIINYVQSLQRQVEFLSMKIEAVNSKVTPSIEGFQTKDFGQQTFETNAMAYGSQATREYVGATSPDWLHMQIGGGFERT